MKFFAADFFGVANISEQTAIDVAEVANKLLLDLRAKQTVHPVSSQPFFTADDFTSLGWNHAHTAAADANKKVGQYALHKLLEVLYYHQ